MKSIKDIAEETINVVVPAAKNAGEYVCFMGKTAKDGFFEGKRKVTGLFKNTDKKKLIINIILTVLIIGAAALVVVETCSLISKFKNRKSGEVINQD